MATSSLSDQLRDKIQYLAFEGGGGRGAAYIGALQCLRLHDIIRFMDTTGKTIPSPLVEKSNKPWDVKRLDYTRIRGVSGTSTGAITACLLAAGYDEDELRAIIRSGVANEFYDDPAPYQCPMLFVRNGTPAPITMVHNCTSILEKMTPAAAEGILLLVCPEVYYLVDYLLKGKIKSLGYFGKKLLKNFNAYLNSLVFDYGLLSGAAIRQFIDDALFAKFGEQNITFERLYAKTWVHLKIASVCVNTREQVWFDHQGPWKKMAVADAVRISMSIPGAFKPVAVPGPKSKARQEGPVALDDVFLFVDGGTLNNLPLHAFDEIGLKEEERTRTKVDALIFGGSTRCLTDRVLPMAPVLGLRLTHPAESNPEFFGDVFGFLGGLTNTLLTPSEVNQIRSAQEADWTIDLDTSGLDLMTFVVGADVLKDVEQRTFDQTEQWYNRKLVQLLEDKKTVPP